MPEEATDVVGYALYLAQIGDRHPDVRVLHGFTGAGVLETIEAFRGDTYRAVYKLRFEEAVYVLHAFKKKSHKGGELAREHKELIERRLRDAQSSHD